MTRPMFVEKTYRPKFARQNFIKVENLPDKTAISSIGGGVTPHPPPEVTPLGRTELLGKLRYW